MDFFRRVADVLSLLLILGLLCETWLVGGIIYPYRVVGGSMANALLGPHHEVVCPHCDSRFLVDFEVVSQGRRLFCPGCERPIPSAEGQTNAISERLPGDRVFLARIPGVDGVDSLKRWDLMVFRHPERSRELVIKRIVGLPGEQIRIQDGDVFANGRIVQKSLRQFLAMSVPVETPCCPSPGGWAPMRETSRWIAEGSRVLRLVQAAGHASLGTDWIAFGIDCGNTPRIPDLLHYNLGIPRRIETINEVPDFGVNWTISETSNTGMFLVQLNSRHDRFELQVDWTFREIRLLHSGNVVDRMAIGGESQPPLRMVLAVCDHQVFFSLNGRILFKHRYVPLHESGIRPRFAVGFGGESLTCLLRDVRVFRDLFYTSPPFTQTAWGFGSPTFLSPDSYYCLGDNGIVSEDSRSWSGGPAIPASLILGRPVAAVTWHRSVARSRLIPVPRIPFVRYIY